MHLNHHICIWIGNFFLPQRNAVENAKYGILQYFMRIKWGWYFFLIFIQKKNNSRKKQKICPEAIFQFPKKRHVQKLIRQWYWNIGEAGIFAHIVPILFFSVNSSLNWLSKNYHSKIRLKNLIIFMKSKKTGTEIEHFFLVSFIHSKHTSLDFTLYFITVENWCIWQPLYIRAIWRPLTPTTYTGGMTKTIFFGIIFHSY